MTSAGKKRDVVAGYYGFGNFGDDLFRDVLAQAMADRPWTLPTISQAQPRVLDKLSRNARAIANVARSRSITLGGGSILGARPPFGIRHIEMVAASVKRIPYCAVGVGVMERLPKPPTNIVEAMSWIGLRSEREFAEMSRAYRHVHYTSDIAYAASRFMGADDALRKERSGVLLIPAGVGELGQRVGDVEYLSRWMRGNVLPQLEGGSSITVLLLQPANSADVAICRSVLELARLQNSDARLVLHTDAAETLSLIRASDLVLTDRLHGAIAAHISGVPFRLSKHHEKCNDLLTDIRHPDAQSAMSYADDLEGAGLAIVQDWSGGQREVVRRHEDHATRGIALWLDHLEARVN